jgi:hypothetical protein
MREYIEHRLSVAGRTDKKLFADNTYELIHRFTGGVPRIINTLCDTALLCAFAEDRSTVGEEDLSAAIEELGWQEHESTTGRYQKLTLDDKREDELEYFTKIEVRSDGNSVSEHLFGRGRVIAGRSPDNEIYIRSKFVSRHHAQLITDEDGCVVEDLNSTNGILIGEKRTKKHRLQDGDIILMGVHELVYTDLRKHGKDPNPDTPDKEKKRDS